MNVYRHIHIYIMQCTPENVRVGLTFCCVFVAIWYTENQRSSIWQFCHHWWHRKLSLRQLMVSSVTTKLSNGWVFLQCTGLFYPKDHSVWRHLSAMTSRITSNCLCISLFKLLIKANIKTPYWWISGCLWGEYTVDWWISSTKDPVMQ